MRYKHFEIIGYKAVEHAIVDVGKNQLIPIIGVNEAGKTSILQAILSFDKSKDKSNGGKHLEYKNKYVIRKEKCSIIAHVNPSGGGDVDSIIEAIEPKENEKGIIEGALKSLFKNKGCIKIARNLDTKKYSLHESKLPDRYHKKIIKYVLENVPVVLYFDDFTDRVPERIIFSSDYSGKSSSRATKVSEWQCLVEEIFKRSTNEEYSLLDFMSIDDADDRSGLLSDVSDILNEEIMNDWKALKTRNKFFSDDDGDGDLELVIDYTPDVTSGSSFQFKVVDKSKNSRSRKFNVTERSKGFQWFFNFTLKLKFNSKYKQHIGGAIYLLDEPGSYLHSSAQEELLRELKKISKTNVILYCTHSQHLLNPEIINISSIRIASREEGSIVLSTMSSSKSSMNRGALTPLYEALRSNLSLGCVSADRVIITEGVTDFYLLKMIGEHTDIFSLENIMVIPGAGASNLKDLISIVLSSTDKFYVIFDKDQAGQYSSEKYKKYFGSKVAEHFIFYGEKELEVEYILEDYLSDLDRALLLELTGTQDIKVGLVELYYSNKKLKKDFFEKIDNGFARKLQRLASIINALDCAEQRSCLKLAG